MKQFQIVTDRQTCHAKKCPAGERDRFWGCAKPVKEEIQGTRQAFFSRFPFVIEISQRMRFINVESFWVVEHDTEL